MEQINDEMSHNHFELSLEGEGREKGAGVIERGHVQRTYLMPNHFTDGLG